MLRHDLSDSERQMRASLSLKLWTLSTIAHLWTLSTGCDECQQAMSGPQLRRRGAIRRTARPRRRPISAGRSRRRARAVGRTGHGRAARGDAHGRGRPRTPPTDTSPTATPSSHRQSSTDSHHRSSPARRSALAGSPGRSPSSITTTRRNHSTLRDRRPTARPLPLRSGHPADSIRRQRSLTVMGTYVRCRRTGS